MANYEYISLPIHLASNKLLTGIKYRKKSNYCLVSYSIIDDEIYFSGVYSEKTVEYVCKSEEEFLSKINQHRLMRML